MFPAIAPRGKWSIIPVDTGYCVLKLRRDENGAARMNWPHGCSGMERSRDWYSYLSTFWRQRAPVVSSSCHSNFTFLPLCSMSKGINLSISIPILTFNHSAPPPAAHRNMLKILVKSFPHWTLLQPEMIVYAKDWSCQLGKSETDFERAGQEMSTLWLVACPVAFLPPG